MKIAGLCDEMGARPGVSVREMSADGVCKNGPGVRVCCVFFEGLLWGFHGGL